MKKNKERNRAKQKQKRATKEKARNRINSQIRSMTLQMRRSPGPSMDMKQKYFNLDDEIQFAGCCGVGECCLNRGVPLDPSDVWRIMHNKKVRETFGIELTMDLLKSADERGVLRYALDQKTGLPYCVVRRDTKENGREYCVFLEVADGGRGSCMLGEDQPTVCKANPVGRMGVMNSEGRLDGWQYVVSDDPCANCMEFNPEIINSTTIEDWMVEKGMEERYAYADLWHGFRGWLSRDVQQDELRKLSAMLLFDYDRFAIEVGGDSKEDAIKNRPKSVDNLIVGAKTIIEGILAKDETVEDKGDADTE